MALVEAVKQRALETLAGHTCEFGSEPLACSFFQLFQRFQAQRLGELVINLRLLGRFDQGCRSLELRRLSGKLLAGVVLRERDFEGASFSRSDPGELFLESRNECVRADRHLYVLAGPAIE